ncbi:DNA-binding protein, partial [Salmonella enterica subsp. enterica serovar Newport]|nr:DNA-binding protein [Salmonella enterica subsp. enterica serovar Panama]EBX1212916.1 DNA-binding protein [Salmonella enterica subsp. enterica serovar Newport]ECF2112889.1 DNA-binding protein [Salmonella enterica subsp. enterica serovar Newport]ECV7112693.1 DNA-binding protein [Salmonella enterica subsp. enterica serovar Newport]ECV8662746.1 DNA-binding protein [Salmonella enterica subsp. enterica serovar Newport]
MTADISYQIEKYCFTEISEPARLNRQWAKVIQTCREQQAVPEERLRLALLNVD